MHVGQVLQRTSGGLLATSAIGPSAAPDHRERHIPGHSVRWLQLLPLTYPTKETLSRRHYPYPTQRTRLNATCQTKAIPN